MLRYEKLHPGYGMAIRPPFFFRILLFIAYPGFMLSTVVRGMLSSVRQQLPGRQPYCVLDELPAVGGEGDGDLSAE